MRTVRGFRPRNFRNGCFRVGFDGTLGLHVGYRDSIQVVQLMNHRHNSFPILRGVREVRSVERQTTELRQCCQPLELCCVRQTSARQVDLLKTCVQSERTDIVYWVVRGVETPKRRERLDAVEVCDSTTDNTQGFEKLEVMTEVSARTRTPLAAQWQAAAARPT